MPSHFYLSKVSLPPTTFSQQGLQFPVLNTWSLFHLQGLCALTVPSTRILFPLIFTWPFLPVIHVIVISLGRSLLFTLIYLKSVSTPITPYHVILFCSYGFYYLKFCYLLACLLPISSLKCGLHVLLTVVNKK